MVVKEFKFSAQICCNPSLNVISTIIQVTYIIVVYTYLIP